MRTRRTKKPNLSKMRRRLRAIITELNRNERVLQAVGLMPPPESTRRTTAEVGK